MFIFKKGTSDKEQPVINVSYENRDGVPVFSVRDKGIGIKSENHEKMFEILQRLHGRSQYEGTGIGLAVCKKMVKWHGGGIWVESVSDKGATFTLEGVI
ncbi:MAG: hypothetical protein KJ630_17585 [Proteobacteria bacterium]|nr:hypothetical protein [Pseudomonadota bacterium]